MIDKDSEIERLNKIKSLDQDVCIGVDVIVGYPNESEEDFLETYNFLKKHDVSYLHVFTYSERDNTEAIKIEPAVPYGERSRRSKILRDLSDQKKAIFYERSVGEIRPVLVEKSKNGIFFGYTDNYIKTRIQGPASIENTIQDVFISEAKLGYVESEVVSINWYLLFLFQIRFYPKNLFLIALHFFHNQYFPSIFSHHPRIFL